MDLKNKVVFITGAASGIGFVMAEAFAEIGAKVVLTDLNKSLVEEKTSFLKTRGYEVVGLQCDVCSEEA